MERGSVPGAGGRAAEIRLTRDRSGGWLAGPIEAVHAALARVLPDARLDDIATVQLRFRPSAIDLIVTGWALGGGSSGIRVHFHGSEGLAEAEITNAALGVTFRHRWRRNFSDRWRKPLCYSGPITKLSRAASTTSLVTVRSALI